MPMLSNPRSTAPSPVSTTSDNLIPRTFSYGLLSLARLSLIEDSMDGPLDFPVAEAPAPGDVIAIAPGILWLRMRLPFALNHINLWLIEDGPGWTAVDTGFT